MNCLEHSICISLVFWQRKQCKVFFFQSLKRYIYTRFDAFNIVPLHMHLCWSRILKWIPFRTNKIQFLLNERTNKSEKTFLSSFWKDMSFVYGVILEGTADISSFCYFYKMGSQETVVIRPFGLHQILNQTILNIIQWDDELTERSSRHLMVQCLFWFVCLFF